MSPYRNLVSFVKKKDEAVQMVVDYHAFNKQTIENNYLLLHIDDLFDKSTCASVFSCLDWAQIYYQTCISKEDGPKRHLEHCLYMNS